MSENFPDDPERLPPARRRRARRLLAPLEGDERTVLLDRLARRSSSTFDFFLFSLVSGAVFSFGLLLDNTPLLVLGAVLAPLMAPVVGVSLGTVVGSGRFFLRSLVGIVLGGLLVFATGALVGYLSRFWEPLPLDLAFEHAQLSWVYFLVLAVGAVFTTSGLANPGRRPGAASVALAYALYLPLTIAGIGLTSGFTHLWPDGLVLYVVHLAWAVLIGAITLLFMGYRPLTLFGYTLGGAVIMLGIVLLVGFSSISAIFGAFGPPMALPTSIPTETLTVTPVPPTATDTTTPVPPTHTLTPSLTPTLTTAPSPTFTTTPTPVYARIDAGEESTGANLRAEPGFSGAVITAIMNGTLVQVYPDSVEVDDRQWAHVNVLPDGPEGWVLQNLLLVATPAPNW
jgi:Domain of unknown function (DUF389)/Bacterial SH3 domain